MKMLKFLVLFSMVVMTSCHSITRDAKYLVAHAEELLEACPDSTLLIIDSVMRMKTRFSERESMEMALLQGKARYERDLCTEETDSIVAWAVPLPEMDRAASYFEGKKALDKAALAALYHAYDLLSNDNKHSAMASFKDAERYGLAIGDSFTVARAKFSIGKMLFEERLQEESLAYLEDAERLFGEHDAYRSLTHNLMGAVFLTLADYEHAEHCFHEALAYADTAACDAIRRKAMNNYAVMYERQGAFDEALSCLRSIEAMEGQTNSVLLYLNFGRIYLEAQQQDSASYYFGLLEDLLPCDDIKEESKVSSYHYLSRFAESSGDYSKALKYRYEYERILSRLRDQRDQKKLYFIQRKYDYDRILQEKNRDTIRNQRIIATLLGVLAFVMFTLFLLYRNYLKEAEAKAAFRKVTNDLLIEKLATMQKVDVLLKDRKDIFMLKDLEKHVFGEKDHWDEMLNIIESLYPGLQEETRQIYPQMDDLEFKVCLLSHFNLSRQDEARLLNVSVSVLDKARGRVKTWMLGRNSLDI